MTAPPLAARVLGYSGLLPFAGLAVAAVVWPETTWPRAGLVAYGAAILSFMGGCRWGFAAAGLEPGPQFRPLAVSVLPSLLAFVVLWAEPWLSLGQAALALLVGFVLLLAEEIRVAPAAESPSWWLALRWPLTTGACLGLLVPLVL